MGDDRLHNVQLQLTCFGCESDGGVVADDFEADLVDDFGNHGIDFGWHDGRTGLQFRQVDFFQTGARTGREQAQVVTDFGQFDGCAFQCAVYHHICAAVGGRFDQVFSQFARQAADFGEFLNNQSRIAFRRIHACTDGGGAEVDFKQQGAGTVEVEDFFFQQHLERLKLLSGSHRHGILKLGAAHFQNVFKLFGFGGKGVFQDSQFVEQFADAVIHGKAEAGRIGVVGGLAGIDMVHRIDDVVAAFFVSQHFQRKVGNDFVGVHVDRSTGAALINVGRELVEAAAFDQYFVAGFFNGGRDFRLDGTQCAVGLRGGFFNHDHAADKLRYVGNFLRGNFKVFNGAQRVDTPINISGDFAVAQ